MLKEAIIMPQTVTEVYDGVLGKKHRIIAMYQDTYRPIFWFQVCQDGSIYCAPDLTVNEQRTIYTGITSYKIDREKYQLPYRAP